MALSDIEKYFDKYNFYKSMDKARLVSIIASNKQLIKNGQSNSLRYKVIQYLDSIHEVQKLDDKVKDQARLITRYLEG